jgi:hypothetical protein
VPFRSTAQLHPVPLWTSARHALHSEDTRGSLRRFALSLRVVRDLGSSSCYGWMAQQVTETACSRSFVLELPDRVVDVETAKTVVETLNSHLASRPRLANAARELRIRQLLLLCELFSWKKRQKDLGSNVNVSAGDRLEFEALRLRGVLYKMARAVDEPMVRATAILEQPYPKALDDLSALEASTDKLAAANAYAVFGNIRIRNLNRMAQDDAEALAGLYVVRIGFGCRLYRLKFGTYPETLAELSAKLPEHFKELPADPFTGKPFLYKRTADGCMVWSVGGNRNDDGGDRKKDIVFELKK